MKSCRAILLLKNVITVLTLSITGFVVCWFLPPGRSSNALAQAGGAIDPLADFRNLPRVSHPACPDCFIVVKKDSYDIFEEVQGTGVIIARQIPNPAPLEPDERRLEFDPETGLPIWYIGHQPYVGPTDEEPFSPEYPVPLIALERIHARVQGKVFSIPGVHGFGIGMKGFVVYLEPKYSANWAFVPKKLEGVPVEVELLERPQLRSHDLTKYRPVPSGVSTSTGFHVGTTGPHIVRIAPSTGEVRIHTLTANHTLKLLDEPTAPNDVQQPWFQSPQTDVWGTPIHVFQLVPCDTPTDPNCQSPSAPVNLMSQTPDVGAIQNFSNPDPYPHTSPSGSNEPIRRLQYGLTSYVNGPSGIIQTPGFGTSAKLWGAFTPNGHAPAGTIGALVTQIFPSASIGGGTRQFKYQYVCIVNLERAPANGDSGALVSGNGTGNRHVFGIFVGSLGKTGYFVVANDIKTAFANSNFAFDHYWGTASGRSDLWWPAATQCDGSC